MLRCRVARDERSVVEMTCVTSSNSRDNDVFVRAAHQSKRSGPAVTTVSTICARSRCMRKTRRWNTRLPIVLAIVTSQSQTAGRSSIPKRTWYITASSKVSRGLLVAQWCGTFAQRNKGSSLWPRYHFLNPHPSLAGRDWEIALLSGTRQLTVLHSTPPLLL